MRQFEMAVENTSADELGFKLERVCRNGNGHGTVVNGMTVVKPLIIVDRDKMK
jgi:hypothetical protein